MATKSVKSLNSYRSNGRNYKKKSCHTNKAAAKSAAKKLRERGMTAQVKKDPKTKKHCVYTAGKRKRK